MRNLRIKKAIVNNHKTKIMKHVKKLSVLFIILAFSFTTKAQEFGDDVCENYKVIYKAAEKDFKPLMDITDGHWASKERYITQRDFKIAGIEGYLVIEPDNNRLFVLNKKAGNNENKQEKIKTLVTTLEKCFNIKHQIVEEDGVKKKVLKVTNKEKKYAITISVMGNDGDDVILTHFHQENL
mgnify:CR=1 FL=1